MKEELLSYYFLDNRKCQLVVGSGTVDNLFWKVYHQMSYLVIGTNLYGCDGDVSAETKIKAIPAFYTDE